MKLGEGSPSGYTPRNEADIANDVMVGDSPLFRPKAIAGSRDSAKKDREKRQGESGQQCNSQEEAGRKETMADNH
jgi:hypothetical protein